MYIVISMPNRKSVACGVSHFMTKLLMMDALTMQHLRARPNPADHESGLMIFISPALLPSNP